MWKAITAQAIVNRGLAGALERVNPRHLSFVPYHGQPYAEAPNLPAEQDAPLHAALRRAVPDDAAGQAISVVHHYPFITDALQPASAALYPSGKKPPSRPTPSPT